MTTQKHYAAKVLIAEDNKLEAALLENILDSFGCEVYSASGLDIVDHLEIQYDLVFLDINMPGISGFYISDNLQHSKSYQNKAPVIMVSAEPYSDDIKRQCADANVDGYVQKPMTMDVMDSILEQFIPDKEISVLTNKSNESQFHFIKRT